VRSPGLADSMSRYLILRIDESPNITLHVNTQITSLEGGEQLEQVVWKTAPDNIPETHAIAHVFLMTGALPATRWLQGCVALNEKGFVRTGSDLTPQDFASAAGSDTRPPQSFETNWPGIFAVGDVRCGSVKRVAAAVGEGSACVQQVHQALRD
jgi:thioredoxin reductase (NADPH)